MRTAVPRTVNLYISKLWPYNQTSQSRKIRTIVFDLCFALTLSANYAAAETRKPEAGLYVETFAVLRSNGTWRIPLFYLILFITNRRACWNRTETLEPLNPAVGLATVCIYVYFMIYPHISHLHIFCTSITCKRTNFELLYVEAVHSRSLVSGKIIVWKARRSSLRLSFTGGVDVSQIECTLELIDRSLSNSKPCLT